MPRNFNDLRDIPEYLDIPPSSVADMILLGSSGDWLEVLGHNVMNFKAGHLNKISHRLTPRFEEYLKLIQHLTTDERNERSLPHMDQIYIESRFLALGPKVYQPDAETCEAMQHVDLKIPMSDLNLPYEALLVIIPEEVGIRLKSKFPGERTPQSVLLGRIPPHSVVCVVKTGGHRQTSLPVFPDTANELVSECIDRRYHESNGFIEEVARLALNLSMLLTYYGTKNMGKMFKGVHQEHKRKKQTMKARLDVNHIACAQEIKVFRSVRHEVKADGSGTHASPRAGWRKGHMRLQPHGPRNSLRKLKFIRPVFINPTGKADPKDYPTNLEPE